MREAIPRIALIGRKMGDAVSELGVLHVQESLNRTARIKVQVFVPSPEAELAFIEAVKKFRAGNGGRSYLPDRLVAETAMFRENMAWIDKMVQNGFTIIDIGNPKNMTHSSFFYDMEKARLYDQ